MAVITVAELDLCHLCACLVANGETDPDHVEAATDAALGVWGDDLANIVMACETDADGEHACETDSFRCDFCRQDVVGERHRAEILS